jgi:chemotaxis protein methyltransferase CheR
MSALTDDYTDFCAGVRALCRIDLSQYKRGQMERRIRTYAGRRGHEDLGRYLITLRGAPEELASFLDRVTINVSQLWRNPEQWDVLARRVLPELAEGGRIRAWSAGCSYGAEAHTLAAVALDSVRGARLEITGTDIDERMITRAREGRFTADDARDAPRGPLERWFAPDAGGWRAKPEVRRPLRFEVGDLLRTTPRAASYDLILCRNTVIYFTEDVRDALHERLVAALRPGGFLVVGSTERVADMRALGLTGPHPFVYRKDA